MTLDEALSEAVAGERITAPHLSQGVYVEHLLSRGFVKCWPVERVEDEPSRTQCDFVMKLDDQAADWRVYPREEQYPPVVRNSWGQPAKAEPEPKKVEPAPVNFCAICDFELSKCACNAEPKPVANTWGNPLKKEPNKWGK
jgi:hypothetical protein